MDPIELAWDDDAWAAYQATTSTNPALRETLAATLYRLGRDPGDAALRTRWMQRPPLFIIPVRSGGEDWVIMWNEAEDGVPQVWYLGPSSF